MHQECKMRFSREKTVRIISESFSPPGWLPDLLHIEVTCRNGGEATASLVDLDNNVGALAYFSNEAEAVANLDVFIDISIPVYVAKEAKHGETPVFDFLAGHLVRRGVGSIPGPR
jgi:hypothetical protein